MCPCPLVRLPLLRRIVLAVAPIALALLTLFPAGSAQAQTALTGGAAAPSAAARDEAMQTLLAVLEDEAARAALIAALKTAGAPGAAEAASDPGNVAQRLAAATVTAATETLGVLERAGSELGRLGSVMVDLVDPAADSVLPLSGVLALVLTILVTVFLHSGLSKLVARAGWRLRPPIGAGLVPQARGSGIVFLLRVIAVLLSWLAGTVIARLAVARVAETGQLIDSLPVAQSLYLNAFAVFGLIRAVLAAVASPDADAEPAVNPAAPGAQTIIYRNLRAVAGTLTQGYMFIVPLSQIWAGFVAARSLRTLTATLAALLALLAIRRISRALDMARGDRVLPGGGTGAAITAGAQVIWRKSWPAIAVAFVLYAWFIAVSRPYLVQEIVLTGTFYTLGALVVMLAGLGLLRVAPRLRAPMPEPLILLVPRLRPRADRIVSGLAWVMAVALFLTAVLLMLAGWSLLPIGVWLDRPEVQGALWRVASALLVVFGAATVWAIVASWIDHRLRDTLPGRNVSARSRTLLALFRNAFTVALAILATMIALSQIGLDIAPLLAGAGVIGLAIGFGAQTAVQDIITGIFIQLENAINEGDVVMVAGISGGVEKITIRSVHLRALDGTAHVVPFSAVQTVSNMTRDFSFHVAEIGVAYKENVEDAKAALLEAFRRLRAIPEMDAVITDPLEMQGVIALGDSAVMLRARIKTLPGQQWGVGRTYTELVKQVMDERGIEIPYPHRHLIMSGPGMLPLPAAAAPPETA